MLVPNRSLLNRGIYPNECSEGFGYGRFCVAWLRSVLTCTESSWQSEWPGCALSSPALRAVGSLSGLAAQCPHLH
jgi:hypothetical protein